MKDSSTEQDIERGANVNTNVGEDGTTLITKIKSKKQKSRGAKKLKELKFAVSEFYLSLILIQNFQVSSMKQLFSLLNDQSVSLSIVLLFVSF